MRQQKPITPKNSDIIATAKFIGVSVASIVMKLGNCSALNPKDSKKGLSGKSQQSQRVFEEFFFNGAKLKAKATEIIDSAPPQLFLEKARLKELLHS